MLNPFAPLIAIAQPHPGPFQKPYPIEIEALTHRDLPGDASCQKTPSAASPDLDQPPQPIEKECLTTS
jgi:hypothetical protein